MTAASAQNNDSTATLQQGGQGNGLFSVTVPTKLNIKDKVFVQNKSPYFILQMVVAVKNDDGTTTTIGVASNLAPGKATEIASYDNNKLKRLRGCELVIKAKGKKVNVALDGADVDVHTPYGQVKVDNQHIRAEDWEKIENAETTYSFRARLFEENHDLYIQMEGLDALDF